MKHLILSLSLIAVSFPALAVQKLPAATSLQGVNVTLKHEAGPFTVQPSTTASPTLGVKNPVVKNGIAQIQLSHVAGAWTVGLSPKLPLWLTLNSNAGDVNANLTGLPVQRLSIDHQAGDYQLKLPTHSLKGTVVFAAGDLDIAVPKNTALRLNLKRFVAGSVVLFGKTVAEGENLQGSYQTDNYGTAANTIELDVTWEAGDITVH